MKLGGDIEALAEEEGTDTESQKRISLAVRSVGGLLALGIERDLVTLLR